jgi:hypothetical protein
MADEETELESGIEAGEQAAAKAHEQYLREREQLTDAARESARTFDKAVLTFGAAVFGFSIAFLKDVAPHPARATVPWLGAAWFCFASGLLLILLSFLFSHRACLFEIECGSKRIADPNSETEKNRWSRFTNWCNFACIGCLFIGLLLWSVFALKNLGQEGNGSVKKIENPPEKKGYVPPPPPAKPPVSQPARTDPPPPKSEKK